MVNVRRVASQVHKQAARLMRAKYMKDEPAWYGAVLDHPPLPLPPRDPAPRDPTAADAGFLSRSSKTHSFTTGEVRPLPITYLADRVRRQFFRDHPFEAFRETTLVEEDEIEPEHEISGKEWTRLSQRGRNPRPEDVVQFAVNLQQHHLIPLTQAYSAAVAQFRSLRAEHTMSGRFALMEAESYGMVFGPSETEKNFAKEEEELRSFESRESIDLGIAVSRKRWKMQHTAAGGPGQWTRGKEYQRLWKEGARPNYASALTLPMDTPIPPSVAEGAQSVPEWQQASSDPIMQLR